MQLIQRDISVEYFSPNPAQCTWIIFMNYIIVLLLRLHFEWCEVFNSNVYLRSVQ